MINKNDRILRNITVFRNFLLFAGRENFTSKNLQIVFQDIRAVHIFPHHQIRDLFFVCISFDSHAADDLIGRVGEKDISCRCRRYRLQIAGQHIKSTYVMRPERGKIGRCRKGKQIFLDADRRGIQITKVLLKTALCGICCFQKFEGSIVLRRIESQSFLHGIQIQKHVFKIFLLFLFDSLSKIGGRRTALFNLLLQFLHDSDFFFEKCQLCAALFHVSIAVLVFGKGTGCLGHLIGKRNHLVDERLRFCDRSSHLGQIRIVCGAACSAASKEYGTEKNQDQKCAGYSKNRYLFHLLSPSFQCFILCPKIVCQPPEGSIAGQFVLCSAMFKMMAVKRKRIRFPVCVRKEKKIRVIRGNKRRLPCYGNFCKCIQERCNRFGIFTETAFFCFPEMAVLEQNSIFFLKQKILCPRIAVSGKISRCVLPRLLTRCRIAGNQQTCKSKKMQKRKQDVWFLVVFHVHPLSFFVKLLLLYRKSQVDSAKFPNCHEP